MPHAPHIAELVAATALLLLVASATLALTKKIHLPFTVVLVLVGMTVSQLTGYFPEQLGLFQHVGISPDLIFFIFLPTLIFESTFNMDVHQLRHNLGPVMTLAVPGLLLSTAIIGTIVTLTTEIPIAATLLLGAILSATDPVAVISLFKQLGAPKRLIILVEGESLFNDATSIVLAKILLTIMAAGVLSPATIANGIVDFITLFTGGLLVGWLMGLFTGWLLGLVESDALIEISLTTALAYLSFLIAEELLHVSGVMATVAAGITIGSWGRAKISPSVQHYMEHFWEYLAFLANALIFLLVGMMIDLQALWQSIDTLIVVILAMLIARAALVYGLVPLVGRWPGVHAINHAYQTVMLWGGLRGAIALAIVLSLKEFGHNELFVTLVAGAVLFTLIVQGLTIGRLMHWLGLDQPSLTDRMVLIEYRLAAQQQALKNMPGLQQGGNFSGALADRIQHRLHEGIDQLRQELDQLQRDELNPDEAKRRLYLRIHAEERALYTDMFHKGHISEKAFRQLLLTLSQQNDAIRFHDIYQHVQSHKLKRQLEPRLFQLMDSLPLLRDLSEGMRLNRLALNYENAWSHYQGSRVILMQLDPLSHQASVPEEMIDPVRQQYQHWNRLAQEHLDQMAEQFPEFVSAVQERVAQRLQRLSELKVAENFARRGSILP